LPVGTLLKNSKGVLAKIKENEVGSKFIERIDNKGFPIQCFDCWLKETFEVID
jgi:hypothetical protein